MSRKKTKIVATVGPRSGTTATIAAMIRAGANAFRINLSHTPPDEFRRLVESIRAARESTGQTVAILADLRGPRIRIGDVAGGEIALATGGRVVLTPTTVIGTPERLSVSFQALADDVEPGAQILLDDGNIHLTVEQILGGGEIACRIDRGGPVSSRRGINLPHRRVGLPALTEKDLADAALGVDLGVDFFALSFVQSAEDVASLNRFIAARGGSQRVIAKIERENAVADLERIAAESFGVMVARGDLALEMSIEETPIAQKRIINVCRALRRPVITATQMLESMTQATKPTRAEAADVANAILDGSDALMLSGETAIGVDPANTVATMARIALRTERAVDEGQLRPPPEPPPAATTVGVLADAANTVAQQVTARVVVAYTDSGESAINVATRRQRTSQLALCASDVVERRLAIVWGVETRPIDVSHAAGRVHEVARQQVQSAGLASPGDRIVILVGTVFAGSDATNVLKVDRIP